MTDAKKELIIEVPEDEKKELTIEVPEELQAKMDADPKLGAAMREMFAAMRQAQHAINSGQHKSFDDAMEAITGNRPTEVDPDDPDLPEGAREEIYRAIDLAAADRLGKEEGRPYNRHRAALAYPALGEALNKWQTEQKLSHADALASVAVGIAGRSKEERDLFLRALTEIRAEMDQLMKEDDDEEGNEVPN